MNLKSRLSLIKMNGESILNNSNSGYPNICYPTISILGLAA
jgi:hypothetical protein